MVLLNIVQKYSQHKKFLQTLLSLLQELFTDLKQASDNIELSLNMGEKLRRFKRA